MVYNLLSIPVYQCLFSTDIKHRYWAVSVYPDNHHYLAFYIFSISQVQLTHMVRSWFFTLNEPNKIIFRLIPSFQAELSLIHKKPAKNNSSNRENYNLAFISRLDGS